MTPTEQDKELREKLAAIEHQRWADWQKWVHKVLREANPSPEIGDILERWDRQIETPYEKLSDREKASDMEQVDRYWPLITADRKRVALEAESELAIRVWLVINSKSLYAGDAVFDLLRPYIWDEKEGRYIKQIEKELKAQQEKL